MNNWVNAATLISGITSAILFLIAAYTFYLTFLSKKISLKSIGFHTSIFQSNNIILLVKNETLSPIYVKQAHLIIERKYSLFIRSWETPLIIKPFEVIRIDMKPFSEFLGPTFNEIEDIYIKSKISDFYVELQTEDNTLTCDSKWSKRGKHPHWNELEVVTVLTREPHNGKLVKPDFAYAVDYIRNNELHTAFISDMGLISEPLNGYNALPHEIINNPDKVNQIIEELLAPLEIKFRLIKFCT